MSAKPFPSIFSSAALYQVTSIFSCAKTAAESTSDNPSDSTSFIILNAFRRDVSIRIRTAVICTVHRQIGDEGNYVECIKLHVLAGEDRTVGEALEFRGPTFGSPALHYV